MLQQHLPTGTLVTIPLSILQSSYYHAHSGAFLTTFDTLIPLNLCFSHAIYDWDRKKESDDVTVKSVYEKTSSAALIAASCTLSSFTDLQIFIPLLYILYHFYDEMKKSVSFAKPFLVSLCWTCAIYNIPLILQQDSAMDVYTPMSCFLLISGWSNFADLKDIDDDIANNVLTPATYLQRQNTLLLSGFLIISSFIASFESPYYDDFTAAFDILNFLAFVGTISSV